MLILAILQGQKQMIQVPSITPRKRAVMEPTGSSQRKDLCSISMFTLDEDSGLGMDINRIPVPTITPEKWVTMGPKGSWQKKGLPSINTSTLDEDSGLGMDVDQGFTLTTPHLGLPIREDNMDDSLTEENALIDSGENHVHFVMSYKCPVKR
ncbi:hypothetical protein CHS0354_003365 [Potamilus streckersoni]|uniref:Uncharacterized protein n=1 Tax=Potamilus streckersoni TaxID=2493646 RepID=A0AAE0VPT4_9BIVA|nr:hypothetical protein CHS0354_003365 [Potamilus streckersoni]